MKKLLTLALLLTGLFSFRSHAQSEERRNKIQMIISFGGKTTTSELNSLSTTISRNTYQQEELKPAVKDSVKTASTKPLDALSDVFYLSMDLKTVDPALLKILAKKQNLFEGSITITDSYGKNPTRTIQFKGASLANYSDHFSAVAYGEPYGSSAISISCKTLSIDGISIE